MELMLELRLLTRIVFGWWQDTLDFVAYVAKDNNHGRACYVLECGGGLAQDVITTIGQAFELRFKEYLKRAPRSTTDTHMEKYAHQFIITGAIFFFFYLILTKSPFFVKTVRFYQFVILLVQILTIFDL